MAPNRVDSEKFHSPENPKKRRKYGKDLFIEQRKQKIMKKHEKEERRIFCINGIRNIWTFLRSKSLRKYTRESGIVIALKIKESGTGYIKSLDVCTINDTHLDCNRIDSLHVNLVLENGKIMGAEPSPDKRGFFYSVGDEILIKGGSENGILIVTKVWPTK